MSSRTHAVSNSIDPTFTSRSRSTWEIVRRVARYLKAYPWMALGTIGCAILSTAFGFAFPKLTQFIIDDVIGGKRADLLVPAIGGLVGAFFLRDLFNSIRVRINNTFEQNVIYDMRRDVYARLQRLPVGYFDQRASGDLMTRVIEDVNSLERILIDGMEQGSAAVLCILAVITIMIITNLLLAAGVLNSLSVLAWGVLLVTTDAPPRLRGPSV